MNQQSTNAGNGNFSGKLFLYSEPEILTVEDHGHLGINTLKRPHDFVKSVRSVPIAVAELTSAQRDYPIVFSNLKQPSLLAVVALLDDQNLFVDTNGEWDKSAYMPAYIRCHPFALAARPDDQYAVVIDRAASVISENPEQPFFDGKTLSASIQARVDFCGQFSAERKATKAFCDKMVELNLLSGQQATFNPNDNAEVQSSGPYIAVDFEKFKKLDAETLRQLHLDGALAAIYAQRFSLENWPRLLERRKLRQSAV